MFYYKETALFLGVYSGFTRGEYHIVCVDFIVALRRIYKETAFGFGRLFWLFQ